MKKSYLYLAAAMMLVGARGYAQTPCATDEMHKFYIQQNPQVAEFDKQLNESIASFIASRSNPGKVAAKTTATHSDTDYYDIPVVVHVMHNYGDEFVKDSNIYAMIADLNRFYNAQSPLSTIIQPFRKYIGNAKMRFHLVSKDPTGQPTKGITRRYTYLTYGGDDQAKMDLWPPRSYYNIWLENVIGRGVSNGIVLAYASFPSSGEALPYYDGVISRADRINEGNTIPHESGHYFDLLHLWNSGTGVGEVCGDDEVDDTPPTKGHFSVCGAGQLYDTNCASNYYKIYARASGVMDSLVNYPDTTNTQNIMDYSQCVESMLTKGQVWRMRAALNSNIGGRNNLWDSTNLAMTGAIAPYPDLPPVADFCTRQVVSPNGVQTSFTFPGTKIFFTNKSWGDTVTKVEWTFPATAAKPTVTATGNTALNSPFDNTFNEPGWVKFKMDVTGNNSGVTTRNFENSVFVADPVGVAPGYMQEFSEGTDRDKWPMFNYYNNNFKWKLSGRGVYDNSSVMYQGFDTRTGTDLLTGTPKGDFDDLYSVPFDLSSYAGGGLCNLNFYCSAASRTSSADNITDTLVIEYSNDKKHTWTNLTTLGKGSLINKGALSTEYAPTTFSDWQAVSIAIPPAARTSYTVFRFRYRPGTYKSVSMSALSSGNNFYMDRVHVNAWPADVSMVQMGNIDVKVMPNPTQGDAFVVVKDIDNSKVDVVVTDITGKMVYNVTEQLKGNIARVQIPQHVIAVKGVYLVQTTTGNQVNTQKLVVY